MNLQEVSLQRCRHPYRHLLTKHVVACPLQWLFNLFKQRLPTLLYYIAIYSNGDIHRSIFNCIILDCDVGVQYINQFFYPIIPKSRQAIPNYCAARKNKEFLSFSYNNSLFFTHKIGNVFWFVAYIAYQLKKCQCSGSMGPTRFRSELQY